MSRLCDLVARREALVVRSAALREELAVATAPIEDALSRVDAAVTTVRRTVLHPAVLTGGAVLLVLLRPRRLLSWAAKGWTAWRFLSPVLKAIRSR